MWALVTEIGKQQRVAKTVPAIEATRRDGKEIESTHSDHDVIAELGQDMFEQIVIALPKHRPH